MSKHAADKATAFEPTPPIVESEILHALERSGYPFEIELLNAFDRAGLDPTPGFRLRVTEDATRRPMGGEEPGSTLTREVDVIARVHTGDVVKHGQTIAGSLALQLMALVEAKSLRPDTAFVGFIHEPSVPLDPRSLRCRFAGVPSFGILPYYNEAAGLGSALTGCLDPLNVGPICVQWALVERGKNDAPPKADHATNFASALSHLVRGERLLAVENTEFSLAIHHNNQARIDFMQPTLFLRTPTLYVYHAPSQMLTKTPHLRLVQYFELHGGQQEARLIDVVSHGDTDRFCERYHAVRNNFEAAIQSYGSNAIEMAKVQAERFATQNPDHVDDVKRQLLGQ